MTLRIKEVEDIEYDFVIACCGYESRSRSLLGSRSLKARRKLAIGYAEREVLSFEENFKSFESSGFEVPRVSDSELPGFLTNLFESVDREDGVSLLLDISCFTRARLAAIVESLSRLKSYTLDVYYSLAEFSEPPAREPRNEFLCPVSSYFAGWTGSADGGVGLICGLGYEQLKALGIIEYIDPFETWLFFPESSISEYDVAVGRANALILREVAESNVLRYPVMDGQVLMRQLLALVGAVREDFRCILMPLGPKVFAFACLLTGSMFRDVSVWRASSGRFAEPRERQASQEFSEFRVTWKAPEA